MTKKQKKRLIRICISTAAVIALQLIPTAGILRLALFLGVYALIGYDILFKAIKGILRGRPFDENFLMAVATVGAFALAIYDRSGDYNEALAVMLFYQIGELFQSLAICKSRKSIGALMDIRPDRAKAELDGKLVTVSPEAVAVGSIIVVEPGDKIPIDGVVTEGCATLDTAALTGESLPRTVRVGDSALSGCICTDGVLKIRTIKAFGASTVSKILELTENASSRKSRSEKFISKFAKIYTPAVCGAAAALALLPPLLSLLFGAEAAWGDWLYRALTFLVISCPCALVISIPLTFFATIGSASRKGILIKGSHYIETLAKTRRMVFDKTGTLTQGVFSVSGVRHALIAEDALIEYAASAECASPHPIAKSLRRAYGKEIDRTRVTNIQEHSGKGVTAQIDGKTVAVGNRLLMEQFAIPCPEDAETGTAVHVALNGTYAGCILIEDRPKPNAKAALSALGKLGVDEKIILTGDSRAAALKVAAQIGADGVKAELLPADKVTEVEKLLPSNGKLAFVGDGINDAPALARADVGIAMGAMGSDAAIEAADVVLMNDDPMGVLTAIKLSRKCIRIVKENIIFSLVVKFLCLALVACGFAGMWFGIFADVGVMVIAVLNAIRAMHLGRS